MDSSAVILEALSNLRQNFTASNVDALAQAVEAFGPAGQPASDDLLSGFIDAYSGDFDGSVPKQRYLIAVLVAGAPKVLPALATGDLTMLAMFCAEQVNSPPSSSLVPSFVDLSALVFFYAMKHVALEGGTPDEDLLASATELCEAVAAKAAPRGGGLPSIACAHAMNACVDIGRALSPVSILEVAGQAPPVDPWPSALPSDDASSVPTEVVEAVREKVLASIVGVFREPSSSVLSVVSAANALSVLLIERSSTFTKPIVAELSKLAKTLSEVSAATARGLKPTNVSLACLSISGKEALCGLCTVVARAPTLKRDHGRVALAASAMGGEVYPALPSALAPVTASAAPATPLVDVAGLLVAPHSTGRFASTDQKEASQSVAEQTLDTSVGPLPLRKVVSLVLESLARLDPSIAATIRDQHAAGRRQMMYTAARKAQQKEYERLRRQQARGIDAVRVGRLFASIQRLKDATTNKALRTMQQPRLRGAYARAAFHAALDGFLRLPPGVTAGGIATAEAGTVARAEALVGRTLAYVPDEARDECVDRLMELLMEDCEGRRAAREEHGAAPAHSRVLDLVFQVLYSASLELAPTDTSAFLLPAAPFGGMEDDADEAGVAAASAAVFGAPATQSQRKLDVADPIAWLLRSGEVGAEEGPGVKRGRPSEPKVGTDAAPGGGGGGSFDWETDVGDAPETGYSSLLVRALHVASAAEDADLTLQILAGCPIVTTPAWAVLHREWCMIDQTKRVERGMWITTQLGLLRPPEQQQCVSLLLFYATSSRKATRLYAIKNLVGLVRHDKTVEKLARETAAVAVGRLKAIRVPSSPSSSEGLDAKLDRAALKHLGLFAVLCSTAPLMLGSLLTAFSDCADVALRRAVLRSADVVNLLQALSRTTDADGVPRWIESLRALKDAPAGATDLVVLAFHVYSVELMRAIKVASGSNATSTLGKFASILERHCRGLFQQRKEVRFLVPVFPFIQRDALRDTYLPAFMHLFENAEANAPDIDRGLRAMVRDSGLGDPSCGMTPKELLLYLHDLPSSRTTGDAIKWLLTRLNVKKDGREVPVLSLAELAEALHTMATRAVVPSLLMRTSLIAATLPNLPDERLRTNMQQAVLQGVVKELVKKSVWSKHPDLWRGVVLFIDKFWPATMDTLLTLPDTTLEATIATHPDLYAKLQENLASLPPVTQALVRSVRPDRR